MKYVYCYINKIIYFIKYLLMSLKVTLYGVFSEISSKFFNNLQFDSNLWDEEDENEDVLQSKSVKLLDRYTKKDIEKIIKSQIPQEKMDAIGLNDWYVEFDLSDPITHSFYVRSKKYKNDQSKFIAFMAAQHSKNDSPYNILQVKWFALQNPNGKFTEKRPRLPGQTFPGTGLGRDCVKIMYKMARNAGRDGVANSPEHFHNAYMYDFCYFVDPKQEGWFRRLKDDLKKDIKNKGLAMVSWAIYLGYLREKGQPAKWEMKEQTMPISIRYMLHFISPKYALEVQKYKHESGPFKIDWEKADKFFQNNMMLTLLPTK